MSDEKIITLTDRNFESEVLRSSSDVLVQFWAQWSPPCRVVSPLVDKVADKFYGRMIVGRLDIDASPIVVDQYRVKYVPTIILIKAGGNEVYRKTGIINESTLFALIEDFFGVINYDGR